MTVNFDLDEWTIKYSRIIMLDPHDEANFFVVFPEDLYIVNTNAQDVEDDMVTWYFKTGDDQLITEMFL